MRVATELLTAEEFRQLPDDGVPRELVRGKVVEMSLPAPKHGYFCGNISGILREHVRPRRLGRVMTNDSGVVTERGPDTVRGGDVVYFSFERLPPGPMPEGYLAVVPEIVFEVRSPTDRWVRISTTVAEYLNAGVLFVCVLDPQSETLTVYPADDFPNTLDCEDELTFPGLLPEFCVRVGEFFD